MSLEGFNEAMGVIFVPNFESLNLKSILEALGHSFFTLSVGMGIMLSYGIHLKSEESIMRSSVAIVSIDTILALAATIIMFSVILSFPNSFGELDESTVGMLFLTLPEIFYTKITYGKILAPLFYLLVSLAALTSTISLLELATNFLMGMLKMTRTKSAITCSSGVFLVTFLCSLSFGGWQWVSDLKNF